MLCESFFVTSDASVDRLTEVQLVGQLVEQQAQKVEPTAAELEEQMLPAMQE